MRVLRVFSKKKIAWVVLSEQSVNILTFDVRLSDALEIALGASSQHIIVEDEQAATKAIDFLKRNRAGRATFLPLTTIKARSISGQNQDVIASSPGFLGMADELVTFDAKLEAIFKKSASYHSNF